MTAVEFKNKYNEVDLIVMGWSDGETAYFSAIAVCDFTDGLLKMLTSDGSFRKTRKNERILRNHIIKEATMAEIDACEGKNRGYKAESFLFGAPNYTDSKVDGELGTFKVQLKTSFDCEDGSTSRSNKF